MKRVIVLFTALCVVHFSAQEKMEKEAEVKNTARLLDALQSSIYEISKLEFGSFLY